MKISIITATFNSARTIKDTMLSVAAQEYQEIEHIIIDGKSKDNTLEIIAGFPHVATVVSEKDNGIYDAMNKGIALSTGDVVGILNSDDFYVNSKVIKKVMKVFADPAVDVVYADLQYVHPEHTNKVTRTWKAGNFSKKKFYFGWMPPHPTFFVRKKVYEEAGYFNPLLKSAADYEFMLRVLLKYDHHVHYIPEVIVKMRTGGISNASFMHRMRANREDREAWRLNSIKPYFFTIPFKPLRKVLQFISK